MGVPKNQNPMNMKKWIAWALSVWLMLGTAWPAGASNTLDEIVEQRFLMMDVPVAPVYDETARWFLERYFTFGRHDASLMLGRAEVWFPIIEQVFEAEGVPVSLKYLAVVESNLQPDALSGAGARGLWQFMPATALQYGLEVSATRDERLDPWRATMAAARYLKDLHAEFGDWELVLAAYNCGSGRVLQAIRRGGTRNYWHLRRYLPRQTARYVSAFLAAAYVCQYHSLHGLEPRPLPEWMRHR
ncbi:MAG: lytic transglycosylase domain-containing protein, partial [Bacteroidetes bacterium]